MRRVANEQAETHERRAGDLEMVNAVEYNDVTFEEFGDCVSLEVPPAEVDEQIETWTRCLFEPEDLLEIRCFPSKQLAVQLAPLKYRWGETRYLHRFEPWRRVMVITSAVDDLKRMNAGVTTKWGNNERVLHAQAIYALAALSLTAEKPTYIYLGKSAVSDINGRLLCSVGFASLASRTTKEISRR